MNCLVKDEDIYRYLLGDVVIGDMYTSPIPQHIRGNRDDSPSFGLYVKDGDILWKDFGFANPSGNKAINLLMDMRDLSYHEAVKYANTTIRTGTIGTPPAQLKKVSAPEETVPKLQWRTTFTDREALYWEKHGVMTGTLLKEGVYALDHYSTVRQGWTVRSTRYSPAFVYVFGENSFKIYSPYASKKFKFRQHNISNVIEGWNTFLSEVPASGKYKTLIITSSTKDRLCVKTAFQNYPDITSINPTSENSYGVLRKNASKINSLVDNVFIMYDADFAGDNASLTLSRYIPQNEWTPIMMYGKLDSAKDFAEFSLRHGTIALRNRISNILSHGQPVIEL